MKKKFLVAAIGAMLIGGSAMACEAQEQVSQGYSANSFAETVKVSPLVQREVAASLPVSSVESAAIQKNGQQIGNAYLAGAGACVDFVSSRTLLI